MKKQYYFATWIRVAATVSILLCHFLIQSENGLLNMSAQFFNIGVDLFIILSGFLFGVRQGETADVRAWYGKRLKRVFIPYEIFVIMLFIVHAVCGQDLLDEDWIWLVLGLQGSVVGVPGAEQTWFITPLLICYAITPLLDRFFSGTRKPGQLKCALLAAAASPLLWVVPKTPAVSTLLSLVSWYVVAFAVGRYPGKVRLTKGRAVAALFIMVMAFAVRLAARHFCDGIILYERLVCSYTHIIAAFCIFYIFAVVFEKIQPVWVIRKASAISFEVYLFHYMFCVGPVRLFDVTPCWITDCVLVTLVTVALAVAVHALSEKIIKSMR